MRKLWMALLPVVLLAALARPSEAQETAQAVVEKAIKAHGGADLLDRHKAARAVVKAALFIGNAEVPAQVETVVQLPSQLKNVLQLEIKGQKQKVVQVLNGGMGWMTIDGKDKPLTEAEFALLKDSFHTEQALRLTPLLRDKEYRLALLPDGKVDGRPALGIKVSHAGRPDISLYFDKASYLVVKTERRVKDSSKKEILQEDIFRDYKDYKGVKRPMKFVVLRDGKKFMEGTVTEFTPLDKVDAKEFAKP